MLDRLIKILFICSVCISCAWSGRYVYVEPTKGDYGKVYFLRHATGVSSKLSVVDMCNNLMSIKPFQVKANEVINVIHRETLVLGIGMYAGDGRVYSHCEGFYEIPFGDGDVRVDMNLDEKSENDKQCIFAFSTRKSESDDWEVISVEPNGSEWNDFTFGTVNCPKEKEYRG